MKRIILIVSAVTIPVLWFIWLCLFLFLPGGNLFMFAAAISSNYGLPLLGAIYTNALAVLIVGVVFLIITLMLITFAFVCLSVVVGKDEKLRQHKMQKFQQWEIEERKRKEEEARKIQMEQFIKWKAEEEKASKK
jgi:hypothetical protein